MPARHVPKGAPVHDAEARGIQALVRALPDSYRVYSNIELASDRRGQTFEHDAIVVAPHALFTVELKSWGGRIVGNRDRWTLADGTVVQSPIPLVLSKARVLKGRLQSRRRDLASVWVQGLVFLSASDAVAQITSDFEDYVVTSDRVRRALTEAAWLGNPTPITSTQRRAIEDYLDDGRASASTAGAELAGFRLVQRLSAEDRPYEAWLGERSSLVRERRVLHTYTVAGDTAAERDRLRVHALREATLHGRLRGGPDILRYDSYFVTQDDPQRLVLQFEDTTPLLPMDAWAKHKKPGMLARLSVAARVARALAWVHERGLVHRRLSPEAVLVSGEEVPVEVRLCAFELARDLTGAVATITGSSLGDPTFRCAAPEALKTGEATPRSDLFSLGATLVELFTGRSLFGNVDEVLRPFTVPPLRLDDRACPRVVAELVAELLAVSPSARPQDAASVADRLERGLRDLTHKPQRTELQPGRVIRETYELVERLGRGATATTWRARQLQTDRDVVLKIAEPAHAHYLQEEGRVLSTVHHPNVVHFYNAEPFDDGNLLVLEHVAGFTATLWAAAGDPLDPPRFLAVARGLLGALGALHEAGWVHRDVKPDNVMLSEVDAAPKLLDLGLAAKWPMEGDLAVGSLRYKDPQVFVQNRWTPANDLFSAFVVLSELLLGTHPFGGAAPEPGQRPTFQREEVPESFAPEVTERLAELFARALSPVPDERPKGALAAIGDLEQALGLASPDAATSQGSPTSQGPQGSPSRPDLTPARPARASTLPPPPLRPLPASVELGTSLSSAELELTARAHGALARLGLTIVADLVGFDPRAAQGLPNVGSKTLRELRALEARIALRWPDPALAGAPRSPGSSATSAARPLPERFYAALADDPRPLGALGRELSPSLREALVERGVLSVGDLATMPASALEQLPGVGPGKLARVRTALRRLAGREALPETLADLEGLLKQDFGDRAWEALAQAMGLRDGVARPQAEIATALGVSRQRVSQMVDLAPLRAEASWGHHLLMVVAEAMPPAGLATLALAAQGLAARLPTTEGGPSALGYARLAGLLLQPDGRATDAAELERLMRPPWTDAVVDALRQRLGTLARWPPVPRATAEGVLWDATPVEVQRALLRWGAEAPQLLDGLLKLDANGAGAHGGTVLVDRVGALYTPPVELSQALSVLRPTIAPVVDTTATLLAEVQAAYPGVAFPDPCSAMSVTSAGDDASDAGDAGHVREAIERAGYRQDGDRWIDPARLLLAEVRPAPLVDPNIPHQHVLPDHSPPVVAALASQATRGGFRVVALPPAAHHKLARRLAGWLEQRLAPEQVGFVPIDRLVIDALKASDLWKFVPYLEARVDADWRMFHAELAAALDDAVRDARPGRVTVLGQPSLLGPLGLMDWLSGFYERARGGRHGLIVLAVPGGIHEDRVRLNEKYNLPYTPDMAAVYLEGA